MTAEAQPQDLPPSEAAPTPPPPEHNTQELLSEIQKLRAKITDYDLKFMDARAFVKKLEEEVAQIRLRSERDLNKTLDAKIGDFILKILPVIDSFELSLRAAESQTGSPDSFVQGVRLIHSQLVDALKSMNVERILTVGEAFNPEIHEALVNQVTDQQDRDGLVAIELKAGYKIGTRVVRPAQVAVSVFHS